jgi:Concanavalin A-like lectin/glucanases superfamily
MGRSSSSSGTVFSPQHTVVSSRKAALAAILLVDSLFKSCLSYGQVSNPPSPAQLSISNLGNGLYAISGGGVRGQTYSIQSISVVSLTNWQTLGAATGNLAGAFSFTDSNGLSRRFYRAVSLGPTNQASNFSPASILGLAYYWNYDDIPIGLSTNSFGPTNTVGAIRWVDEVQQVVFATNGTSYTVPTNTGAGIYFSQISDSLTNGGITMTSSNFSVWMVYREVSPIYGANLFGNNSLGKGLISSAGAIDGNWPNGSREGPSIYPGPRVDLVDSQGTVYTNGVLASGLPIGQPPNDFKFDTIGGNANLTPIQGYIEFIGIWTNTLLTLANAVSLENWVQTNGVTNVTSGLIAWWKLDEGSGTNIMDSSGNGHNGTLVGGVGWTGGVIGTAITNNGTTSYADITSSGSVADNLADFSVSCWFLHTDNDLSQPEQIVGKISNGGLTSGYGWTVFTDTGTGANVRGAIGDATGNAIQTGNTPPTGDGKWHHYVWCKNSSGNVWLYMDGLFIYTADTGTGVGSVGSFSNTNNIRFGADYTAGDSCAGAIDDVRIYGRVLSPKEVDILYRWRGQP